MIETAALVAIGVVGTIVATKGVPAVYIALDNWWNAAKKAAAADLAALKTGLSKVEADVEALKKKVGA